MAALAGIDVDAAGYRLHYCKGSYFSVAPAKARLVSRLVYPVPGHVSLGVHAVVGPGRAACASGPTRSTCPTGGSTTAWTRRSARAFGERRAPAGARHRRRRPGAGHERHPAQAPGPGRAGFRDFVIAEESARGLPGLVNLVGIDSPGLTSSPAIARRGGAAPRTLVEKGSDE